jgi:hypothetical protein
VWTGPAGRGTEATPAWATGTSGTKDSFAGCLLRNVRTLSAVPSCDRFAQGVPFRDKLSAAEFPPTKRPTRGGQQYAGCTRLLALNSARFGRTNRSMEHRGVRYTIRAGIERGSWSVAIYPDGVESVAPRLYGSRTDAESRARSIINRLLKEQNAERKQLDG